MLNEKLSAKHNAEIETKQRPNSQISAPNDMRRNASMSEIDQQKYSAKSIQFENKSDAILKIRQGTINRCKFFNLYVKLIVDKKEFDKINNLSVKYKSGQQIYTRTEKLVQIFEKALNDKVKSGGRHFLAAKTVALPDLTQNGLN